MIATYWILAIGHLRLKDLKKNQNPYKSKISKANSRKRTCVIIATATKSKTKSQKWKSNQNSR